MGILGVFDYLFQHQTKLDVQRSNNLESATRPQATGRGEIRVRIKYSHSFITGER